MASLKVLRRRIRSVTSTQQITKAMEMVSAAKLRRAQGRALAARPYAVRLTAVLERVATAVAEREDDGGRALTGTAPADARTALVVMTSNRGLCGGFNTNLFRAAEERVAAQPAGDVGLVAVGRKGRDYFRRRRLPVLAEFADLGDEANVEGARRVTEDVLGRFQRGEVGRVEILYTRFFSAVRRQITFETFLPVAPAAEAAGGAAAPARDVLFEPGVGEVFDALLPRFATARMLAAWADSRASEEGARMMAMGAANKNAGELLDGLVLERNRLRQRLITKEILDIVGGAEALT
jgi:F-type H+-transporting ATPase subunit gamma